MRKFVLRRIGSAAVIAVAAFSSPAVAGNSEAELAKLLAEVDSLNAEAAALPKKAQANLAVKAKHEQDYKRIDAERKNLEPEEAAIEAQRPTVASLCSGTVPEDQYAAAVARCHAVLDPFNNRIKILEAKHKDLDEQVAQVDRQEDARVAEGKALAERNSYIGSRRTQLDALIKLTRRAVCVERCTTSDTQTCLSACYDGASTSLPSEAPTKPTWSATPNSTPNGPNTVQPPTAPNTVAPPRAPEPNAGQLPKPTFSAAPNRTPEQAIEEYKNSGREKPAGPRPSAPPPPPPATSP